MNLTSNLTGKRQNMTLVRRIKRGLCAFTLPEVVISLAISSISIGGIMYGYVISARRAEWSGYSLAAHTAAIQILERTRAARWDPTATPAIDLLTTNQFPTTESVMVDLPVSGTNVISVTARTTITTISVNPPVKMVEVECSWPFLNGRMYTNKVVTYRSPS